MQLRVRGEAEAEALTSGSRYLPSSSNGTDTATIVSAGLRQSNAACSCRAKNMVHLSVHRLSPKRPLFAVAVTPLSCDDIREDRWLSQGDLQLEGPRSRLLRRLGGVESNHVLPRPANAEGSPRIAVADRADMRIPASGFPCEGQQEAVRLQCAGQGHPITPRSNIRPRGCVHYGMAGSSKSRESLCRMQYPGAKFPVHTADVITHRCFSQLTVICGTPEAPGTPRICSVRLAQVDAVCSRF